MKIEVDVSDLLETGEGLRRAEYEIERMQSNLQRMMSGLTLESRRRPSVDNTFHMLNSQLNEIRRELVELSQWTKRKGGQFREADGKGRPLLPQGFWKFMRSALGVGVGFLPMVGNAKRIFEALLNGGMPLPVDGTGIWGKAKVTEFADEKEVHVSFQVRAGQVTEEDPHVNSSNLAMLLKMYANDKGYTLFPGEVTSEAYNLDEVPKFMKYVLEKGYDPETFEYLEYHERSEVYRRIEDKVKTLEQEIFTYQEHALDGYEVLAFGKGFFPGAYTRKI